MKEYFSKWIIVGNTVVYGSFSDLSRAIEYSSALRRISKLKSVIHHRDIFKRNKLG